MLDSGTCDHKRNVLILPTWTEVSTQPVIAVGDSVAGGDMGSVDREHFGAVGRCVRGHQRRIGVAYPVRQITPHVRRSIRPLPAIQRLVVRGVDRNAAEASDVARDRFRLLQLPYADRRPRVGLQVHLGGAGQLYGAIEHGEW